MNASRITMVFIVSSFFLAFLPSVDAQTTYTWTSTADFNGGDKGLVSYPGNWTVRAQYPLQTSPTVASHGGFIYAFGGFDGAGTGPSRWENRAYRYNPQTNAWTQIATMPQNRSDAATAVWNDRIYLFAGGNQDNLNLNIVTYYNVTTGAWSNGAGLGFLGFISGEGQHAATHCSTVTEPPTCTFIYLSSGGSIVRYNPVDGAETLRSGVCSTGIGAVNTILGDYWYFMGGKDDTTRKARRYDINADTCNNAYDDEPFEARRYEGAYEGEPVVNGRLYFVSGFDGAGGASARFYRTAWEWEPIGRTWRQMAAANIERSSSGTNVNGIVYILAGVLDNGICGCASRTVEALDPLGITYDGRNQVDSSTDSPRTVDAGEVRISSAQTDTFPRSDWVGNPFFWNPTNRFKYGPCSYTIASGNASLRIIRDYAGDTLQGCAITSAWTFNGDFDVRGEITVWGNMTGFNAITVLNTQSLCPWGSQLACGGPPATTGIHGYFAVLRIASGNLDTYTITNGQFTSCGASVPGLGTNEYVRIRKIGSQWTSFYGTDGIGWTQATQCTAANNGPWWYSVFESGGTLGVGGVALKDFYLESASVLNGGFRSSGQWKSPGNVLKNTTATTITLDHSLLASDRYVSAVEILVDGDVVWSDGNDRKTGTTTVYTMNQFVDGNVAVRVTLAGSGSASPALKLVSIVLVPIPSFAGESFETFAWILWIALTSIGVVGVVSEHAPMSLFWFPAGILLLVLSIRSWGTDFSEFMAIGISVGLVQFVVSVFIALAFSMESEDVVRS